MIRPLNLQIAVIVLEGMACILAAQQARGQAMPATVRASGASTDTRSTKAPDDQEARSASMGSSRWTAGATSIASPGKGTWGGSQGFSSTPKPAWTLSSEAFSQGAVQPSGVWRTRPSFSTPPEGATSTNGTEAESVSAEAAPSRGSISGIGSHQSGVGSRHFGIGARQSTMSGHQFSMQLRAKAGDKPATGISGQRHSFTATSFGATRSMRGAQFGSVTTAQHRTTRLGDRPSAPSRGLAQPRAGIGLGGTGFDSNRWDRELHSGDSKPQ